MGWQPAASIYRSIGRLRTTTLAAKERDAQLRRAAHALQRLQTSGLAAMAAGHAERQKEKSLAADAWPLGPLSSVL